MPLGHAARTSSTPDAWSEEGYVETLDAPGGAGRRLVLRSLRSAPGHGVVFEPFSPSPVSINHGALRVRGVEPVNTADGVSAMVQEWLIQPRQ